MALISNKILLKLGLYILSTEYPENGAPCFTKVTEYNNISFNGKVVENEDSIKDEKEAVTNSEKETSKKRTQYKTKRDAAQAQALLLAVVPRLFILASAFVPVPESFAAMSGLSISTFASISMPKSFVVVIGLSVAMPRSSTPAFASVFIPGLSTAMPGLSVAMVKLFAVLLELFIAVPKLFIAVPGSFLPKTPIPNLAVRRQKLDDTISE